MILTLARRTLLTHPVRTAVLAAGFGMGVAVMGILLGIAQVVLEQAQSPALVGGGDVAITPVAEGISAARLLLSSTLHSESMQGRVLAASPWSRERLYLLREHGTVPVKARGGVPSAERALGDQEIAGIAEWADTDADMRWARPEPGDVLRSIDRFHPVPSVPERASSWAEWLYFNGRSAAARFYLTFLVGPLDQSGRRTAGVRLQLERDGRLESFTASNEVDETTIARAPDLTIGPNSVRLAGLRYLITLDLQSASGERVIGNIAIESQPGRAMPPIELRGARGWRSGYVVPVMSGTLAGTLLVNGERISLDGGSGYHDHNWGFWEGVSWQWGQVQHDDVSIVFGRVFPPLDAADPDRIPGFMAVVGPTGPIAYSARVAIEEASAAASSEPATITVRGRSNTLNLTMTFAVEHLTRSRAAGALAGGLDFLQMRGHYNVKGSAASRQFAFEAAGSAETFRGN